MPKLTALSVAALAPGEYPDSVVPGLVLRVGAKRRTWTYRSLVAGKRRRDPLGFFPQMSLAQARAAATKHAERLESGVPLEPAPLHPRSPDVLTLGKLLDRYERVREAEGRRVKRLSDAMRVLRKELAPWLDLPATSFGKAELRQARDRIADRGHLIAANRLLSYAGAPFKWAAQEDLIAVSPVPLVRKGPERKRQRVLSRDELGRIWRAAEALDAGPSSKAFGRLIRFLIVTACRRDEAASLRFADILDGTWTLADSKTHETHGAHRLRLPPLALAQIGEGAAGALAFRGVAGKLSGWAKLKATLDRESGVTGWRLHDFRRSASTIMGDELEVPEEVIERLLGHARPGIASVYQLAEHERRKGQALARWADFLQESVIPAPTVVPIRRRNVS